jgi:hypothetical protein
MSSCPRCDGTLSPNNQFCSHCDTCVYMGDPACATCGHTLCPRCGTAVGKAGQDNEIVEYCPNCYGETLSD